MIPLTILLLVFSASLFILKYTSGHYDPQKAGRIALSIMLLFTASGHILFTPGMVKMIPDFIPFKTILVYLTAAFEVLAALALHISSLRSIFGWLLILFFVAILPANIKAAVDGLDYQTASYTGKDLHYLWFRVPLQVVFIIWVYLSAGLKRIEVSEQEQPIE